MDHVADIADSPIAIHGEDDAEHTDARGSPIARPGEWFRVRSEWILGDLVDVSDHATLQLRCAALDVAMLGVGASKPLSCLTLKGFESRYTI